LKKMLMPGPLGVLAAGLAVATTKVEEDIDGAPLGVLSAGLAATTTEVEEDADDTPPWESYQRVRQWPPL
jgi:hypothetical protein